MIDADVIGHEVIGPDGPASEAVARRWPAVVESGHIDRRLLGSIVFSDPLQLAELEALTHPHIRAEILRRVDASRARLVVVEVSVPSVLQASWPVILVDAPVSTRLERLAARGLPEVEARKRMAAQMSRADWLEMADHVIDNGGRPEDLERLVAEFVSSRRLGRATGADDPQQGEGA